MNIYEIFRKAKAVLNSCKTFEQLKVAKRYIKRAIRLMRKSDPIITQPFPAALWETYYEKWDQLLDFETHCL